MTRVPAASTECPCSSALSSPHSSPLSSWSTCHLSWFRFRPCYLTDGKLSSMASESWATGTKDVHTQHRLLPDSSTVTQSFHWGNLSKMSRRGSYWRQAHFPFTALWLMSPGQNSLGSISPWWPGDGAVLWGLGGAGVLALTIGMPALGDSQLSLGEGSGQASFSHQLPVDS